MVSFRACFTGVLKLVATRFPATDSPALASSPAPLVAPAARLAWSTNFVAAGWPAAEFAAAAIPADLPAFTAGLTRSSKLDAARCTATILSAFALPANMERLAAFSAELHVFVAYFRTTPPTAAPAASVAAFSPTPTPAFLLPFATRISSLADVEAIRACVASSLQGVAAFEVPICFQADLTLGTTIWVPCAGFSGLCGLYGNGENED